MMDNKGILEKAMTPEVREAFLQQRKSRPGDQGTITRTCRSCGKTFTLPENVQHWPDYCRECRAKAPAQTVTRKCRGCGKEFTFLSTDDPWPKYCRDCHDRRDGEKRK